MSAPPPLPPVPLDGDVNHGRDLNGVIWFFTGITTLIFFSRLYARKVLTHNLGWDDAILALSVGLLYVQCVFVSISVHYGLGRHGYYIVMQNPLDMANVVKWQLYSEPIAILGGTVPKIAVTMLIIKLLNPGHLSVAYLWSLNILLNALSIVCIITSFVQCTPTSTYWTRVGGTCWDPSIVANLAISQGSLSAFTDFNLALFPITVIWSLQMSLQKKLAVCFLMGFGCLAGVAAIIRTTKLAKLSSQSDMSWEFWTLVLWVAIECCVIISCACIPSLRPLFRNLVGESATSTFPSLGSFGRRFRMSSKGSREGSYALSGSPGEKKKVRTGVVDSGRSSEGGSEVSFARGVRSGIRTTTEVSIQRGDWR